MSDLFQRPRRRGGCLYILVLLFVLGPLVVMAIDAAFAPWIYVVGGKLRPLPVWHGVGDVQAPSGRYRLYIWFSPSPSGSRVLPTTQVLGGGYVCTPRGDRFSLQVTGSAPGIIWRDMDGHEFGLSVYHRPTWQFSSSKVLNPRLRLHGRWVGPNLVMSDEGSFAHAFLADGSLNTSAAGWYPKSTDSLPITLTETGWWWSDCPKPKT